MQGEIPPAAPSLARAPGINHTIGFRSNAHNTDSAMKINSIDLDSSDLVVRQTTVVAPRAATPNFGISGIVTPSQSITIGNHTYNGGLSNHVHYERRTIGHAANLNGGSNSANAVFQGSSQQSFHQQQQQQQRPSTSAGILDGNNSGIGVSHSIPRTVLNLFGQGGEVLGQTKSFQNSPTTFLIGNGSGNNDMMGNGLQLQSSKMNIVPRHTIGHSSSHQQSSTLSQSSSITNIGIGNFANSSWNVNHVEMMQQQRQNLMDLRQYVGVGNNGSMNSTPIGSQQRTLVQDESTMFAVQKSNADVEKVLDLDKEYDFVNYDEVLSIQGSVDNISAFTGSVEDNMRGLDRGVGRERHQNLGVGGTRERDRGGERKSNVGVEKSRPSSRAGATSPTNSRASNGRNSPNSRRSSAMVANSSSTNHAQKKKRRFSVKERENPSIVAAGTRPSTRNSKAEVNVKAEADKADSSQTLDEEPNQNDSDENAEKTTVIKADDLDSSQYKKAQNTGVQNILILDDSTTAANTTVAAAVPVKNEEPATSDVYTSPTNITADINSKQQNISTRSPTQAQPLTGYDLMKMNLEYYKVNNGVPADVTIKPQEPSATTTKPVVDSADTRNSKIPTTADDIITVLNAAKKGVESIETVIDVANAAKAVSSQKEENQMAISEVQCHGANGNTNGNGNSNGITNKNSRRPSTARPTSPRSRVVKNKSSNQIEQMPSVNSDESERSPRGDQQQQQTLTRSNRSPTRKPPIVKNQFANSQSISQSSPQSRPKSAGCYNGTSATRRNSAALMAKSKVESATANGLSHNSTNEVPGATAPTNESHTAAAAAAAVNTTATAAKYVPLDARPKSANAYVGRRFNTSHGMNTNAINTNQSNQRARDVIARTREVINNCNTTGMSNSKPQQQQQQQEPQPQPQQQPRPISPQLSGCIRKSRKQQQKLAEATAETNAAQRRKQQMASLLQNMENFSMDLNASRYNYADKMEGRRRPTPINVAATARIDLAMAEVSSGPASDDSASVSSQDDELNSNGSPVDNYSTKVPRFVKKALEPEKTPTVVDVNLAINETTKTSSTVDLNLTKMKVNQIKSDEVTQKVAGRISDLLAMEEAKVESSPRFKNNLNENEKFNLSSARVREAYEQNTRPSTAPGTGRTSAPISSKIESTTAHIMHMELVRKSVLDSFPDSPRALFGSSPRGRLSTDATGTAEQTEATKSEVEKKTTAEKVEEPKDDEKSQLVANTTAPAPTPSAVTSTPPAAILQTQNSKLQSSQVIAKEDATISPTNAQNSKQRASSRGPYAATKWDHVPSSGYGPNATMRPTSPSPKHSKSVSAAVTTATINTVVDKVDKKDAETKDVIVTKNVASDDVVVEEKKDEKKSPEPPKATTSAPTETNTITTANTTIKKEAPSHARPRSADPFSRGSGKLFRERLSTGNDGSSTPASSSSSAAATAAKTLYDSTSSSSSMNRTPSVTSLRRTAASLTRVASAGTLGSSTFGYSSRDVYSHSVGANAAAQFSEKNIQNSMAMAEERRRQILREKFVTQCKKYVGVPFGMVKKAPVYWLGGGKIVDVDNECLSTTKSKETTCTGGSSSCGNTKEKSSEEKDESETVDTANNARTSSKTSTNGQISSAAASKVNSKAQSQSSNLNSKVNSKTNSKTSLSCVALLSTKTTLASEQKSEACVSEWRNRIKPNEITLELIRKEQEAANLSASKQLSTSRSYSTLRSVSSTRNLYSGSAKGGGIGQQIVIGSKKHEYLQMDCCGMVKTALTDLAGEIGWQIKNWNQAYQYCICTEEVSEEKLQPGDLIYYEGEYVNQNQKPQPFNIVHTEVYVGPGELSIGARHSTGVSFHESYWLGTDKYPAKTWNLKKLHFRSLNPFLMGKDCNFRFHPAVRDQAKEIYNLKNLGVRFDYTNPNLARLYGFNDKKGGKKGKKGSKSTANFVESSFGTAWVGRKSGRSGSKNNSKKKGSSKNASASVGKVESHEKSSSSSSSSGVVGETGESPGVTTVLKTSYDVYTASATTTTEVVADAATTAEHAPSIINKHTFSSAKKSARKSLKMSNASINSGRRRVSKREKEDVTIVVDDAANKNEMLEDTASTTAAAAQAVINTAATKPPIQIITKPNYTPTLGDSNTINLTSSAGIVTTLNTDRFVTGNDNNSNNNNNSNTNKHSTEDTEYLKKIIQAGGTTTARGGTSFSARNYYHDDTSIEGVRHIVNMNMQSKDFQGNFTDNETITTTAPASRNEYAGVGNARSAFNLNSHRDQIARALAGHSNKLNSLDID